MRVPLQIYDSRERALVRAADVLLAPMGWRRPARPRPVTRVLLLRLERIGDLLMILDAIADARRAWPDAQIDLAVAAWNASLATLIPGIDRVLIASPSWLARQSEGDSTRTLIRKAGAWRREGYDLVVNFEPDIRGNGLAWLTRAPRRVGYSTGGGGALLTDATAYDPTSHVSVNARALIARAAGTTEPAVEPSGSARLALPPSAYEAATRILGDGPRPWIGIHASGGRQSKQWHLDRFAAVARQLGSARDATVVLTGAPGDRPLVDALLTDLGQMRVVDAAGQADLPTLAALLSQLDVFVTGDTGPMHLAAAVGTPIVALFGPSQPARYGPLASVQRVVRVDLPCSPCGQVRLPPDRCRGHVPDCMDGISVSAVCAAVSDVLDTAEAAPL